MVTSVLREDRSVLIALDALLNSHSPRSFPCKNKMLVGYQPSIFQWQSVGVHCCGADQRCCERELHPAAQLRVELLDRRWCVTCQRLTLNTQAHCIVASVPRGLSEEREVCRWLLRLSIISRHAHSLAAKRCARQAGWAHHSDCGVGYSQVSSCSAVRYISI